MNTRTRRTLLCGLALVLTSGAARLAAQDMPAANMPTPASIHQLAAPEVIAQIIEQRHELLLSDAQFEELSALFSAVRDGRIVYESTGRSKPPYQRAIWITTPEQALARAFTILTPQQQHASLMLFANQGRVP